MVERGQAPQNQPAEMLCHDHGTHEETNEWKESP